jgi:NAD(P)-dependent dehydrogenase (short-subunit alcohol dehydrogenase family)
LVLHVHTSLGEEVAREVHRVGRQAVVLRADLSRSAQAYRLSQDALAVRGRIDILVNNAAVFSPTPMATLTLAAWQAILGTNLTAPFILSLVVGRTMRTRGYGKIIQLGDWSGLRPMRDYLPYCVAKGGLHALTITLAKALAPEVQVNTVAPGPVLPPPHYDSSARQTLAQRTPLGRLGDAKDVARAVRFLVEAGDFVTGTTYVVDGGWLAEGQGGTDTSL